MTKASTKRKNITIFSSPSRPNFSLKTIDTNYSRIITRGLHDKKSRADCEECGSQSTNQPKHETIYYEDFYRPALDSNHHTSKDFPKDAAASFFIVISVFFILLSMYSLFLISMIRLGSPVQNNRVIFQFCGIRFKFPLLHFLRLTQMDDDFDDDEEDVIGHNEGIGPVTRTERRRALEEILRQDCFNVVPFKQRKKNSLRNSKSSCDISDNNDGDYAIKTKDEYSDNEDLDKCSICLGYYENEELVFSSPNMCSHEFHLDCILSWLERHRNNGCPYCRQDFVKEADILKVVDRMRKEDKGTDCVIIGENETESSSSSTTQNVQSRESGRYGDLWQWTIFSNPPSLELPHNEDSAELETEDRRDGHDVEVDDHVGIDTHSSENLQNTNEWQANDQINDIHESG